jgi:rhodanese-related sulfurtransferase
LNHFDFLNFEKKNERMFFRSKVDLTPSEFKEALKKDGGKILDCRTAAECADGVLPNAIQSDWMNGETPKTVENWDKQEPVYCYCRSGGRSDAASKFLREQGFESVFNIGGYSSLKD